MTITEFLLARIAEDEEGARAASEPSPNWERGTEETGDGENIYYVVEPVRPYVRDVWIADLENTGRTGSAHGDHIARHDPARVLRECAAKRAIINRHRPGDDVQRMVYGEIYPCTECGDVDDSPCEFPCPTVKALAAVYSDHADYQQEWAV